MNLADIRQEYSKKQLEEKSVDKDPVVQFKLWFQEAMDSRVMEPTAMHLATATHDGKVSGRMVLLKGVSDEGFIFYTNYRSKKGRQLALNPFAALTFFWPELERQVRIEGAIEKTSEEDSEKYFNSRPRLSQLSASVSPQSQVVSSRQYLEDHLELLDFNFADKQIIRPPDWGGYIVKPQLIEFWQGRPGRLHDRIQYTLQNQSWKIERLAP